MTEATWAVVEVAARLLPAEDREVVLGDLAEAGESSWRGSLDVLDLAVRRQLVLWKNWRPWAATLGVAVPSSFLLMGFCLSVSLNLLRLIDPAVPRPEGWTAGSAIVQLLCHGLLLLACSWTGGFVVGSLSRRTLWVSLTSCCMACSFCLVRFRVESLSRLCLLLFLPPAIFGAQQGLRKARVGMSSAVVIAVLVTTLMIPSWSHRGQKWWNPPGLLTWILSTPAWFMVVTARKKCEEEKRK
jgi:hypothetical protein